MTDMGKKVAKGAGVSAAIGAAGLTGYLMGIDPTHVINFFSDTAQSQIAQAGFFFTLASWLHSSRVKKEIKDNFSALTMAIQNLGGALRADLNRMQETLVDHGERLEDLESGRKGHSQSQGELNV